LITSEPLLSRDEEIALVARIKSGDEDAKRKLVEANIRLVIQIASRGARFSAAYDRDDAIMEGIRGLYRAVDKYDPDRFGVKFSTYASYWIRNFVHRGSMRFGEPVRKPDYLHSLHSKCRGIEIKKGNEAAIMEATGKGLSTASMLIDAFGKEGQPLFYPGAQRTPSGFEDDWDRHEGNFVVTCTVEGDQHKVDDRDEVEWLMRLMENLSEQERFILYRRFGFVATEGVPCGREPSWIHIGAEMNLAGYQASKIGWRAIRKLRVFAGLDGGENGDTLDMLIAKKKRMVSGSTPSPGASDAVPRDRASD
jgi:RNA polymerase primary sigma factor